MSKDCFTLSFIGFVCSAHPACGRVQWKERGRVQYYGKRASGRRAVGSGRRENKRLARCDQCQNRKGEREGEVGEREAKEGRVKREGG